MWLTFTHKKQGGEFIPPPVCFTLCRYSTKDYSLIVLTASLALLTTSGGSET